MSLHLYAVLELYTSLRRNSVMGCVGRAVPGGRVAQGTYSFLILWNGSSPSPALISELPGGDMPQRTNGSQKCWPWRQPRLHPPASLPAAQEALALLHERLWPQGLLLSRQLRSPGAGSGCQLGGLQSSTSGVHTGFRLWCGLSSWTQDAVPTPALCELL